MTIRRAFVLVIAAGVIACSSAAASGPSASPTSAVIGASGGSVASSDGALDVTIPAGALPGDVTITVTPVSSPAPGAIGQVYELGPTGTTFAAPVTLTFHYADDDLDGKPATGLRVATVIDDTWQALGGSMPNTSAHTVSGTTTHLSPYGLIVDASGRVCLHAGGAVACAAKAGSGTSCPPPQRCATSTPCQSTPGTTLESCVDNANGYDATCCFPAGEPACFTGAAVSCASKGGTSCPPPPTCATSNPCQAHPGSTLKSCVDGANGFTSTCCYPPGVAPPPATSSSATLDASASKP